MWAVTSPNEGKLSWRVRRTRHGCHCTHLTQLVQGPPHGRGLLLLPKNLAEDIHFVYRTFTADLLNLRWPEWNSYPPKSESSVPNESICAWLTATGHTLTQFLSGVCPATRANLLWSGCPLQQASKTTHFRFVLRSAGCTTVQQGNCSRHRMRVQSTLICSTS